MAGNDFRKQVLGQSDDIIHTSTFTELEAATDAMAAQARQSVRILSHDTEPELYGRPAFVDLLGRFISARRQVAKIRLLIADPRRATAETHRLVELWHRFPSFIDIRELRDEYAKTREAFMIVDDTGMVRRPERQDLAAVVTFRSIASAPERAAWFDEAWERSAQCVALRRLRL